MDILVKESKINGSVIASPSKSYAHRLILASFLSGQRVKINNVGTSQDVLATLNAIKSLGASVEICQNFIIVERKNLIDGAILDCNESGSTLRFLMPIIPALSVSATLTGKPSLLSRPNDKLIECLQKNGAEINGFNVSGKLTSGTYYLDASVSSQYVTGLLLALSIIDGKSKIVLLNKVVSSPYILITIDVLKKFGVQVSFIGSEIEIQGNTYKNKINELTVEGDWSGSAFTLSLGAVNGCVTVKNLNVNSKQGDKAILDILRDFGAMVKINNDCVTVSANSLKGIEVDIDEIPDLAQVIASVASHAKGKTVIKNISRLKIKESDRALAIVNSLSNLGVSAKIVNDTIEIIGGKKHGGIIDGGNDHRTVMAGVVSAVNSSGEVKIVGAQAINKSYPNFLEHFKNLGGKYDVII